MVDPKPNLGTGIGMPMIKTASSGKDLLDAISVAQAYVLLGIVAVPDYNDLVWTDWVPLIVSSGGAIAAYTINRARYVAIGKLVIAEFYFTIDDNGTGSGLIFVTVPATGTVGSIGSGLCYHITTNETIGCWMAAGGTAFVLADYDGTYPGITGNTYSGTVIYEAP